jgi:hypothetical protein
MYTTNKLLDKCAEACSAKTDAALAKLLEVGRSAVSNYRHGRAHPDVVVCERIALLSGVPLQRVLGIVGEARAISREEKAVWRKLATAAVVIALLVSATAPALASGSMARPGLRIMHIM